MVDFFTRAEAVIAGAVIAPSHDGRGRALVAVCNTATARRTRSRSMGVAGGAAL